MRHTLPLSVLVLLLAGCAAFNRVQATHNRHTTIGQELIDLKKAKDLDLISEQEYTVAQKRILKWSDATEADAASDKPRK